MTVPAAGVAPDKVTVPVTTAAELPRTVAVLTDNELSTGALTVRVPVAAFDPSFAFTVPVTEADTGKVFAVNVTDVPLAGMVTDTGTMISTVFDANVTVVAALTVAPSFTVPVEAPAIQPW
jgi:hypothetical protein